MNDGYLAILTFTGAALAALGFLVVLLAALRASGGTVLTLFILTVLVGLVTVGEGLLLLVAYQQQQAADVTPNEVTQPPEPETDPAPQRPPSGDYSVSCGSGGCFENGTAVDPVSEGEACTTGGTDGAWEATNSTASEFICAPTSPAGAIEDGGPPGADPARPVACFEGDCRQDGNVVTLSEGETCDLGAGAIGTWAGVRTDRTTGADVYECRGD